MDQYKPLLADAALYRQAALARHVTAVTDQSRDEIKVTILADLQDSQDKEGRMLSERITEMVSIDRKQVGRAVTRSYLELEV